ncbi:serine/threonine-protein kinase [Nocardioides terrigena]|uniref:serine/threonine-protein kinase n=1 Tax=Nocardioides terrigena TaxID=424797 RepID=UPI000D307D80|nr:serine/threonine-protein kinase [Nocardioides terrigena]
MTTSRPEQAPPGLRVGGYELLTRLGEGGMGVVHLARRPGGERVALKVLRPHIVGDDEARHRLAREVNSLSRIKSRRVAEIVDADPWGDIPFVATRYVPGLSLHDHVHEEGPLAGADLVWAASCLAEALAAVHEVGVLHRDIKPSNVLMEGRTPILIDFGLARVADDPKLTHTGWLLGTPGYLAPEILYGDDATAASDVHSWAATVAFAGTGRPPFGRGPSVAVMDRVRRGEHDLADLDPVLRPAIEEALDPDPSRRPSLPELRQWLDRLLPSRAVREPDPFTMPMAVATLASTQDTTEVVGRGSEPLPADRWRSGSDRPAASVTTPPTSPVHAPEPPAQDRAPWTEPRPRETRVLPEDGATEAIREPGTEAPPWAPPPRAGGLERFRRGTLVLAGAAVVGAGVAVAPYVTALVAVVVTWLLRSGSLAGSAAGARRQLRGTKWYDAPQLLLATPWHALAAVPGVLLLVTWSLGLAMAAALLCFAAGLSLTPSLGVIGLALALAMWWGPGSSRLRRPVQRLSHPVASRGVPWFLAMLVLVAAAAGLASAASSNGTQWAPAADRPLADVRLPGWL